MSSLSGKNIAITRGAKDAADFIGMVESEGGRVLALPTIQLVGRGHDISGGYVRECNEYKPDHIVFMSSRAVALLFEDAARQGTLDQTRFITANANVVSVGPKTSAMLERYGIQVNSMPKSVYSSVGIGEVFSGLDRARNRVLVPRSGASTPFLGNLLKKIGFDVRELYTYDVQPHQGGDIWLEFVTMLERGDIHGIIFTSVSSVRAFMEIMGRTSKYNVADKLNLIPVVSIGPFTAAELRKARITHTVAPVHTVAGSMEVLHHIL